MIIKWGLVFIEKQRPNIHNDCTKGPHTLQRWANGLRSPAIPLAAPDTHLQTKCKQCVKWSNWRGKPFRASVTSAETSLQGVSEAVNPNRYVHRLIHRLGLKPVRCAADNDISIDPHFFKLFWDKKMHDLHRITRNPPLVQDIALVLRLAVNVKWLLFNQNITLDYW